MWDLANITHNPLSSIKNTRTPSFKTWMAWRTIFWILDEWYREHRNWEILFLCYWMVSNTVQHFIRVTPIHGFGILTHPHMTAETLTMMKTENIALPEDGGSRFFENVGWLLATTWLYIKWTDPFLQHSCQLFVLSFNGHQSIQIQHVQLLRPFLFL